MLRPCWGYLGPSRIEGPPLGPCWARLGPSWAYLGPTVLRRYHIDSSVATGLIDHRGVCGHRFRVWNGRVTSVRPEDVVRHSYRCPFCDEAKDSTVATGCIDHRHGCGNRTSRMHGHLCQRVERRCGRLEPQGEYEAATRMQREKHANRNNVWSGSQHHCRQRREML